MRSGGLQRLLPFLLVSVVGGVAMLVATPPFAVPDEPGHFYRAWSLSEGNWRAEVLADGRCGASLPFEVVQWTAAESQKVVPGLSGAAPSQADSEGRVFAEFRGAAQLPVLLYVPQGLGVLLARLAGGTPAAAFHAGRISSLLLVSLCLGIALSRVASTLRASTLAFALPTALALRASLSADAVQLGLIALFCAEAHRATRTDAPASSRTGLVGAMAALGCVKLVYLPLALLVLPATSALDQSNKRRVRVIAAFAWLSPALYFAWESFRVRGPLRHDVLVDPLQNLAYYSRHPWEMLSRIGLDYARHAPRYLAEAIGSRLGWLDVPLPTVVVLALLLALAVLALGDRLLERPSRDDRAFATTTAVATSLSLLALSVAQLIQWTPLHAVDIEGLQGRYFLPFAPPLLLAASALPQRLPRISARHAELLLWLGSLVSAAAALLSLRAHYC